MLIHLRLQLISLFGCLTWLVTAFVGACPRMLSKIKYWAGWYVDYIEFHFTDGTMSPHGKKGGEEQEPYDLQQQEIVTAVEQVHATNTYLGMKLTFTTSLGRQLVLCGKNPQHRRKNVHTVPHLLGASQYLRKLRFEGDRRQT